MAKFRKKPVVIEAWQYLGREGLLGLPPWMPVKDWYFGYKDGNEGNLYIRTLEGDMRANPGDWIIKGIQGELYACKSNVFEATYEPVNDLEASLLEANKK